MKQSPRMIRKMHRKGKEFPLNLYKRLIKEYKSGRIIPCKIIENPKSLVYFTYESN